MINYSIVTNGDFGSHSTIKSQLNVQTYNDKSLKC